AEDSRLWFTTALGEVRCLDVESLRRGERTAQTLWRVDMVEKFDVFPQYIAMSAGKSCSIAASYRNLIYVITGNGTGGWEGDRLSNKVHSPAAPSLICLDKRTGDMVWEDHSPGQNILKGQWG